jgi:hypothetical protein
MGPSNIPNREKYYIGTPPDAVNGQTGVIDHVAFLAEEPTGFIEKFIKNNILILFDNNGNDFGEFVKKIKEYSDDISNRFGCNTHVFFKNSELCDFTDHKGIPLRLNDDINSFKIIYNKTF